MAFLRQINPLSRKLGIIFFHVDFVSYMLSAHVCLLVRLVSFVGRLCSVVVAITGHL